MNHTNAAGEPGAANLRFARLLVDELQAAGVVAAFVCPGSRSTPLVLAVASQPGLQYSVHLDERSAAFHALGYAKATGRPVALVCTSGTAGANFLPAVAEASHARVPLVVLTADRPPELRAWGAAQTMEQRSLFAGFARWSEEAPCPSEGVGDGYARALARRAVAEAMGAAPGPVHLNLPFREPLVPATIDVELPPGSAASVDFSAAHTRSTRPRRHDRACAAERSAGRAGVRTGQLGSVAGRRGDEPSRKRWAGRWSLILPRDCERATSPRNRLFTTPTCCCAIRKRPPRCGPRS